MTSQSVIAPERMRTKVKVAGSMLVCLRARRQRMELLAKAIIASAVRLRVRTAVTWHHSRPDHETVCPFPPANARRHVGPTRSAGKTSFLPARERPPCDGQARRCERAAFRSAAVRCHARNVLRPIASHHATYLRQAERCKEDASRRGERITLVPVQPAP